VPTATQLLADHLLDAAGPLDKFVAARRAEGLSWRHVARALEAETGIDVTPETLRQWYPTQVGPTS
jgi:intein-encoded DNA endonuclease-like protein